MRDILVEVYSLRRKKLTYTPRHGDGDYYDDYCGYDVREIKAPDVNTTIIKIRDRRNSNHEITLTGRCIDGVKEWLWEERDDYGIRKEVLPYDHISAFTYLDDMRIYLF